MSWETALVLDTDAAGYPGAEGLHFAGFPGVWFPDRPVAASELGFDDPDEAVARATELGLPLTSVNVEAGSAPPPPRPNHALSETEAAAVDAVVDEEKLPSTHAALNLVAEEAGLSWPDNVTTVAEKQAFLRAAASGEPLVTDQEASVDLEGEG